MTDNQLAELFRAHLLYGLSRHGHPNTLVVESNQPTTQGRTDTATLYYFALPERRYGWQHRSRTYDEQESQITTKEGQWIESAYQLFAMVPQRPRDLSTVTPKDLLNLAALICNSEPFLSGMRAGGAGVQRITEIRNPFFVNDRKQFEASPSFDITISHKREIIEITPVTTEVTHRIFRV